MIEVTTATPDPARRVFQSRTGVLHRPVTGCSSALWCNARYPGIKGSVVTVTEQQFAQARKCEKCFPVAQVTP